MMTSSEWIAGGSELLDIATPPCSIGAHQIERADGDSLLLLVLGDNDGIENAEVLFIDLVATSAGQDFHVVMVECTADGGGLRRTRIASNASVHFDEEISMEDVHKHLLRWWNNARSDSHSSGRD